MHEISLDRYYNRLHDHAHYSDYKQLLFRAGDALQSAEMNEIQGTFKRDLNFLAERYMQNGEFMKGGEVETTLTKTSGLSTDGLRPLYDISISTKSGLVFMNGNFISVAASNLFVPDQDIPNSDFRMGVMIKYEVICSETEELIQFDETLKDPAQETINYKQRGACRQKITGVFILEDDFQNLDGTEYITIFRIKNGEVYNRDDETNGEEETINTFEKDVTNIVARYDRNANGNYLIKGYETEFTERLEVDGVTDQLGPYSFSVADGDANVDGYNYLKDISQDIVLPSLIDFELKQSEPVNFKVSGNGWYRTRHSPIRKMFRISGQKQILSQEISHGSYVGATDELPDILQPVIVIDRIFIGPPASPTVVYVQNVDYELDGDSIKWLLHANNEPTPSSTYYVDFKYQYTEVEGNFSTAPGKYIENGTISDDDYSMVYLAGFADNTTVNIDYDFVLKRIDAIFIDATGQLGYIKGVPNEDDPRVPDVDKDYSLKIAEVLLQGEHDPEVTQSSNRVFKMSDIQLLLDSIRQNEYNVSRLALQQNLQEAQPGATLKGQFVDPFMDDSKRDDGLEYVTNYIRGLTIGGNLIMNIKWETINLDGPDMDDEKMSIEMPSRLNGHSILSQVHYTKNRQINEYLFKSPPSAKISIKPSVYRWISETHYRSFVSQVQSATRSVNSWRTRYKVFGTHRWHSVQKRTLKTTSVSREILGRSVNRTSSIEQSRRPAIIPRISIRIRSNNAYNAHEPVNISLDNKYAATLTANANGRIDGNFTVPARIVSGSKEVKAVGTQTAITGTTLFKAEPLSRTVQTTVTTWWRWVVRRQGTVWREADPVAQSFVVDRTMSLDRINIVFDVLPTTDVSCVVCETSAGFPDKNKAIISKTLSPNQLATVKHTQPFIFDNKVVLTKGKEYAFIIICKDAVGRVQVARLGEKTKDSPHIWLTGQAYSVGTLYNSSNNSAWTPLQEEDMRFWIYECTFNEQYDYKLDTINVTNATDFMIMANAKVYPGCSIQYRVELLDRPQTSTFPRLFVENSYSQAPLENAYTGRVKVTVEFHSNGKFTPVLDPNIQFVVGRSEKTSSYTSVGFDFDKDEARIKVMLDNYRPSNTNISCQVQFYSDVENDVYQWFDMTEDNSKPLGNDWIETGYTLEMADVDTLVPGFVIDPYTKIARVRVNMDTTNDKNRPIISNLRLNTQNI